MSSPDPRLRAAIEDLYRIAVTDAKSTSTKRLASLAEACVHYLDRAGLPGAEAEVTIPGGGREKDWDVAWRWAGKYRLVLSLKSLLKNIAGTVPNRIDDAMGETTSIQLYSPEVVTGYVMVIDRSIDRTSRKHGSSWIELLRSRLTKLSGRRAPYWSPGTFEGFAIIEVDFSSGPDIVAGSDDLQTMIEQLAQETKVRNPGILEIDRR